MNQYCLDTNIIIYQRAGNPSIDKKLQSTPISQIYTTDLSYAELIYGAHKSKYIKKNLQFVDNYFSEIQVVSSSLSSMKIFGETKAKLSKKGITIDNLDLLIASICISNNLILVTHNLKHFSPIPHLQIEDWLTPQ